MALTAYRPDVGRVGLVVIDLGTEFQSRWIAISREADVVSFHWLNEERLLFNVADLNSGSGEDYRLGRGLYSVKNNGSEFQILIRQETSSISEGRDRSLGPEHVVIHIPPAITQSRNEELIIGRWDVRTRDVTPLILNAATGRVRAIDVDGAPPGARNWFFNRQFQPVAVQAYAGGRTSNWLRRVESRTWERVGEGSSSTNPFTLWSAADDGQIYVTYPQGKERYLVLAALDTVTGKPINPPLVRTPGFDFEGELIFLDNRLGGVRLTTDAETTVWFDERMKVFQEQTDKRLPGRINRISCSLCGTGQMRALVYSFSDRDPGQYWLFDAKDNSWRRVARTLEEIEPAHMAMVSFHRFKARDGREVPVWVTRPVGLKAGERPPAVMLVHGGPWLKGTRWEWRGLEQFLASRGYVVISPEFRGSRGYGLAHLIAGFRQWGQAMQDDVADALLWAQTNGYAGPQACIAGGSYGGYSALMGLIRHPELYRCGVAWVAVTDLLLLVDGSFFVIDDLGEEARSVYKTRIGDPVQDEQRLRANSPVELAHRIKAPVMLAFGEEDLRVPIAHGNRMRRALLQTPGRELEWVSYPGEGHGWRRLQNRIDFAARLERFLAQHLNQLGSPTAQPAAPR